jgi:O-methyltransferase
MTLPRLREKASTLLKKTHRLTQSLSRRSVDNHIENYLIDDFTNGDYGSAYGIRKKDRVELVDRMRTAVSSIPSATRMLYHVILARELMKMPAPVEGDVIECGAYKGASSASLSLACALVGRKLWVCDSFAGLPVSEAEIVRDYPHLKVYGQYREGMYSGTLIEVQENVRKYGAIEHCEFVPGLFSQSLRGLSTKFVLAFLDVDLTSSMEDCIRHIWPNLVEEGLVYTDDSCDMEVVRVWFDDDWWQRELGRRAPGYVGSGCGLPVSVDSSSLGYVQKVASIQKSYKKASFL